MIEINKNWFLISLYINGFNLPTPKNPIYRCGKIGFPWDNGGFSGTNAHFYPRKCPIWRMQPTATTRHRIGFVCKYLLPPDGFTALFSHNSTIKLGKNRTFTPFSVRFPTLFSLGFTHKYAVLRSIYSFSPYYQCKDFRLYPKSTIRIQPHTFLALHRQSQIDDGGRGIGQGHDKRNLPN